jgi:hypothetical protein
VKIRLALIAALVLAGACSSVPADPATNVSAAEYRSALKRVQQDLSNVVDRMRRMRDQDLTTTHLRPESWWNAQIGVIGSDAAALISDTLAGSTVGTKAPAK